MEIKIKKLTWFRNSGSHPYFGFHFSDGSYVTTWDLGKVFYNQVWDAVNSLGWEKDNAPWGYMIYPPDYWGVDRL